jgi:CubicO group peptidase (beta-lactamase class C family)
MKTIILPGLMVIISNAISFGQVEALGDAANNPNLPGGYAIALINKGKVDFKKAWGYASSELEVPFTSSTVFDFASVAKQFTGFGIASLVESGALSLDDDIRKYLPWIPDFGELITIRHLLYHTSGIRDWVGLVKLSGRYKNDVITDDFLMEMVQYQQDLNFSPGERFQYSNTGYFLLARILSQVTGQSFRAWTHEHIFRPLEMKHTHFSDDYAEIIAGRASSYKRLTGISYGRSPSNLSSYGSSSLFSTLDDMVRWIMNFHERKIGSEEVWEMMLTKGTLRNGEEVNYGFGLSFGESHGFDSYGHGGSWGGCVCSLSWFPDPQFGLLFISNRDPSGVYLEGDIQHLYLHKELAGEKPAGFVGSADSEGAADSEEGATHQDSAEEAPAERRGKELAPEMMEEYVGYYYEDDRLIKAELIDRQLVFHFPWESNVQVFVDSADRFFLKNSEVQYTFHRDKERHVDQMSIVTPKGSYPHRRIDPMISDNDQVRDICGKYYSDELQTSYVLKIEDGMLIADHFHNEDVELLRLEKDVFKGNKWWFSSLEFVRDKNGVITGFRITADEDNVQNLLIRKINNYEN